MDCRYCKHPVAGDNERRVEFYQKGKLVHVAHATCSDNEERAEYKRTGYLSTNLTTVAALAVMRAEYKGQEGRVEVGCNPIDREVNTAMERLHADVKRFEVQVWFSGVEGKTLDHGHLGQCLTFERVQGSLQTIIEDSPHRTLTGKCLYFTVTGQTMAGRALVELESDRGRITLIAAAGEQTARMGVQGIQGTEDECRAMIAATVARWRDIKFKKAG